MPLRLPPPPPEGPEIISTVLRGLLSTRSPAARALSGVVEEGPGLTAAAPHLVYFVGLDDVARGEVLSAARPTSWRYILLEGDRVHAAAELSLDDYGGVEGFSHVDAGPFVESMVAGVSFAEWVEADRGGDYEMRLLSVPSLYLVALWLHGAHDLLVPLAPAPGGLDPKRAYTEEEMFSALGELIARRTSLDDPMP
jgi:hypothetical protein